MVQCGLVISLGDSNLKKFILVNVCSQNHGIATVVFIWKIERLIGWHWNKETVGFGAVLKCLKQVHRTDLQTCRPS